MQNMRLEKLSSTELLDIRDYIEALLRERVAKEKREIQRTLFRISKLNDGRPPSKLKGAKVAPKYRNPETGDTWAGRGAKPRWLRALMRKGRKLDEFAIERVAARKKRAAKKGRKKKAR